MVHYGNRKHMLQDPICYEKGDEFQKEINGGLDPHRIKKENLTTIILRVISVIIFTLNALCLKGQISNELLQKAIEDKNFVLEFKVNKIDSIMLYDKNGSVTLQNNLSICSKKITVVRDSKYNVSPEKYSIHKVINLIVLYKIITDKNKTTLMFWRPYTGASVILKYKYKRGKYKLIEHFVGTF